MNSLGSKHILLIVAGGIAAYKVPDVVRRLREAGAEVRVVLTAGGAEFITPLTLQVVSGQDVRSDLFDAGAEAAMGHIELARWADLVLIAPASADFLARARAGLAGDLAGAVLLATTAPVLAAPSMNQQMWSHAATRENLALLEQRGWCVVGPEAGSQACGETGPGRLAETTAIIAASAAVFSSGSLSDRRVLVTAGPTCEPIDPVRFISNRSSGKMGYAIASAARDAGARVTLVSGPTVLAQPLGVGYVGVNTAAEMLAAVMGNIHGIDVFIATAAVADYRPAEVVRHKTKRNGGGMTLELMPNDDILKSVAALDPGPFTVGFAAETDDVAANARKKLVDKAINMIAANAVGTHGTGFDADENELLVLWPEGEKCLARASKTHIARELVELISARISARYLFSTS